MNEYLSAISILDGVINEGKHLDECFDADTSPLVQQICYGSIRHYYFYDAVIDQLVTKKLPDKHSDIRLIMLTGLYSFDHLHRPEYTSVNQAVEAVNELEKSWAKGLVNAILRRYGREKDALTTKVMTSNEAAATHHPLWMMKLIRADWPDKPEIFDNNNQQAPMTLRVNQQKISRDAYLETLANENIKARAGSASPNAIVLGQPLPVTALPGFAEGLVSVQDEAPQLAPYLMDLKPGLTVLDACAAPGGKTCHIMECSPETDLTAIDWDKKRINRISENLSRLSLKATVVNQRVEEFETETGFDRVLLDVPCSATGIIRRHPDIKILRTKSDIDKLAAIQSELIDKAFDLLKEGGELLYSTCSILQRENDGVISEFLKRRDCELVELPFIGETSSVTRTGFGLQYFPTQHDHDGFYYAAVRKTAA
ncbi:MAG: 16S rRNA (cytosine967-C5)-methyltransferase [Candidatus Azotimanducaceae bacterium]|jgi:16S rRNA (cytosine967-C5)-methyltransferase